MGRIFVMLDAWARPLAYLLAALVVAAAWAVIWTTGDVIRSNDERAFMTIAGNLTSTGVYAEDPGVPTAYRAPGIVFFISPVVALGGGLVEARLLNAVLVGLGLAILFHLVRRHASPLAGLFAVGMVPLWPVVLFAATTIYPQTLAAFLLVLTIYLIDRVADSAGRILPVIWAALACGALILTVPVVLLLFPFLVIWLIVRSPRWFVHTVLFCIISGATVCTWTARNYLAFDAFVPVATSSGYNLLAGNSPNTRFDTSLNVRFPEWVYTEITGKNEVERNDIMTHAALEEIRNDPERFFRLYGAKFLHWFDYSNRLMSDGLEQGASSVPVNTREVILLVTYFTVILGPLLVRLFFLRRVPFTRIEWLFLALWIGAGLAYALFFTRVRFRLPFDWLIISSNAMFLAALVQSWLPNRSAREET